MDDILTLIKETQIQDEYGVWRDVRTERQVYCIVKSASRAEFFGGGRNGLNPEYEFDIFAGDYEGETLCIFHDLVYTIYRTYRATSDYLELYAERKGGSNAKASKTN